MYLLYNTTIYDSKLENADLGVITIHILDLVKHPIIVVSLVTV